MSDEGVGVRVVHALTERRLLPEGVGAVDLGTGGLTVLHVLSGRRKAILVDCAHMNEAPGTWRRFTPDEVRNRKVALRYSLHEGDALQTLELARQLGECPPDIRIIGIQPARVEPGDGLSPVLSKRFEEYVQAAVEEAANHDG